MGDFDLTADWECPCEFSPGSAANARQDDGSKCLNVASLDDDLRQVIAARGELPVMLRRAIVALAGERRLLASRETARVRRQSTVGYLSTTECLQGYALTLIQVKGHGMRNLAVSSQRVHCTAVVFLLFCRGRNIQRRGKGVGVLGAGMGPLVPPPNGSRCWRYSPMHAGQTPRFKTGLAPGLCVAAPLQGAVGMSYGASAFHVGQQRHSLTETH